MNSNCSNLLEGEQKKSEQTFLSLEAIFYARVLQILIIGKLFIIKFPHFKGNLIINNLFQGFEALWPKILPPDLKAFVHFFLLTL